MKKQHDQIGALERRVEGLEASLCLQAASVGPLLALLAFCVAQLPRTGRKIDRDALQRAYTKVRRFYKSGLRARTKRSLADVGEFSPRYAAALCEHLGDVLD